jgi:hypothetical protein
VSDAVKEEAAVSDEANSETIIGGDMGTGGAPSLPLADVMTPRAAGTFSPDTSAAPPPAPKESFLVRNVPGLNMPAWQVMLGGVGILAVTVGVVSLFTGSSKPSPRRMLRGY